MHNFPPIGGPRSFRWLNLVKSLSQRGWSIDVLTVRPSPNDSYYDESLLKEIPSEITIYRSYPGIYYSLQHIRKRPIRGFPKATIEWLPFGLIRGFSILKERQYDLIISSGLPFVGHLVAYFLKKKTGLPWITDYGDPFSFNSTTSRLKRFAGGRIEGKILQEINGFIVPCNEMCQDFLDYFPVLRNKKSITIGHGISNHFEQIRPMDNDGKFIISHVGSFYKNDREPNQFFKALRVLKETRRIGNNVRVLIVGNINEMYIAEAKYQKVDDIVEFPGFVPYFRALSILKGSSVILYIGDNWQYHHLQYKFFESVAIGRPILAITQSQKDCGPDYFQKNKLGVVVSNDIGQIEEGLYRLYNLWENHQLESTFQRMDPNQFLWEKRGEELEFFIKDVLYNR